MPLLTSFGSARSLGFGVLSGGDNAMEAIASVDVPTTASSITFSAIPQDYDSLLLIADLDTHYPGAYVSTSGNILFNNSTSSFYWSYLECYNSNKNTYSVSPPNALFYSIYGNTYAKYCLVMKIENYTEAKYKPFTMQAVSTDTTYAATQRLINGHWASNSAVTSLKIQGHSTYPFNGGNATLFGIRGGI